MRLLFVGGCTRSGTSLVQKVLACHSRIAGGPELMFTGRIAGLYRRMAATYPAPYSARIEAFYDREELAAAFRSLFGSLFRKLQARKPGALYFSEKTPSNISAAAQLLEIFPDGRFVHILRDGRDVLASHRDVRRRFDERGEAARERASLGIRAVSGKWNRAADAHFKLIADRELAGRYFWLKYEDLLRDPPAVLAELFGFLELDVEARALAPQDITAEEVGVPIAGLWYTEEMYRQGFDPRRIGRWRTSLPLAVRLLGSLLMAGNLKRLSYTVGEAFVQAHRPIGWLRRKRRRAGARRRP